jgi:ribosomal protein S18 acetylase RimI-like enzyme
MKIIPCKWKHHAALAELGASTFYETFRPHNSEEDMQAYLANTYTPALVQANLKKSGIHYFLGYDNLVDQGYIKLIENPEGINLEGKIMELEKIYVRSSAQGSGLAKLLMEQATSLSKQLGFDYLYLGVWQENTRAIAFYKKFGFEIFDTRKFQLGSHWCEDYLLSLKLT